MTPKSGVLRIALLLLCALPLQAQKKAPQPPIRFQGAPQYTQQELLAAAGFKPDARLNPREAKAHAKQLNDTGLFDVVKINATARQLVFTLTPTTQLFPLHLDNLPLAPGKDLDATLHARFPLYRGQLPASGSMLDGICRTLEQMLAAKGMQATVKATPTSGVGPQKLTAMSFTIASPAVHIGRIQLAGVSAAMQAKVSLLVAGQTGNGFDTENTAPGLQNAFEELYQDQGYAAVQVTVAQLDPVVTPQSVDVPFVVTLQEGGIYKVGTIDLPAGAPVARAEVDKMRAKYPASSGRPLDLFEQAVRDAYHAKGFLDCSVEARASFNEATHIVNYTLEIEPGTQYRFAQVQFDGAPDAMAAKLKLAWKVAPGDVLDLSYLDGFVAAAQKKDKQLTKWLQTVVSSYDVKPDPATHQVNCIFHFAKPVQNAR